MLLKEIPLKSIPVMTTEMGSAANFKTVASKIIETYETSTFHKESMESKFQETQEIFNSVLGFSDQSILQGNMLSRTQVLGTTRTIFEDIALSDAFLKGYYTQVQ